MIFDCHAYVGHYPFRPLRYNNGNGLLELMDREGIDCAVVGSLNALFYRDVQAANEELALETASHRDRLVPLATLNPAYPGNNEDFDRCFGPLKMRGLLLCPNYHGYSLDDDRALSLIKQAAARGKPLFLRMQVEDPRKQHRLVQVPRIPVEQIASMIRKLPGVPVILLDIGGEIAQLLKLLDKIDNIYVDFCRAEVFSYWDYSVGWLIEKLGVDHVLFGTGMPFDEPRISRIKLEALDLPVDERSKISGVNLSRLLNRNPLEWTQG